MITSGEVSNKIKRKYEADLSAYKERYYTLFHLK